MDMATVVSVALFSAYVLARLAAYRSAWREQAGACFRCRVKEPVVRLGGKDFCEACADTTLRNYRMGFRFFVFLGILMTLLVAAIVVDSGGSALSGLGPMGEELALVLLGLVVATIWIRKGMRREELQ